MTFQPDPEAAAGLGEILISARSLAEYRAMFNLTDADLARRILDCPGGAAGFAGEVRGLGGDVTACDVAYLHRSPDQLAALAADEAARGSRFVADHSDQYEWAHFQDPEEHRHARAESARRFAADIREHPQQYVGGQLPSLPFADSGFDLALSSHLLFSYADSLDHEFHVRSIRELMRVAGELRVFPLVAVGSDEPYPRLAELLGDLRAHAISCRLVEVDYRFQRGAAHMLVCVH